MNSNAGGLYMLDKILGNYDAIEREAEASHEIIENTEKWSDDIVTPQIDLSDIMEYEDGEQENPWIQYKSNYSL